MLYYKYILYNIIYDILYYIYIYIYIYIYLCVYANINVTLFKAIRFYKELGLIIDFLLLSKLIHQY